MGTWFHWVFICGPRIAQTLAQAQLLVPPLDWCASNAKECSLSPRHKPLDLHRYSRSSFLRTCTLLLKCARMCRMGPSQYGFQGSLSPFDCYVSSCSLSSHLRVFSASCVLRRDPEYVVAPVQGDHVSISPMKTCIRLLKDIHIISAQLAPHKRSPVGLIFRT